MRKRQAQLPVARLSAPFAERRRAKPEFRLLGRSRGHAALLIALSLLLWQRLHPANRKRHTMCVLRDSWSAASSTTHPVAIDSFAASAILKLHIPSFKSTTGFARVSTHSRK